MVLLLVVVCEGFCECCDEFGMFGPEVDDASMVLLFLLRFIAICVDASKCFLSVWGFRVRVTRVLVASWIRGLEPCTLYRNFYEWKRSARLLSTPPLGLFFLCPFFYSFVPMRQSSSHKKTDGRFSCFV